MSAAVEIVSFGYLHDAPPAAHMTLDLRHHFRDPHVSPELRHMTAHDLPVRRAVLTTPGISDLVTAAALATLAFSDGPSTGRIVLAVGCAGGRHRAATVAMAVADRIRKSGLHVDLTHRDLDKAVLDR